MHIWYSAACSFGQHFVVSEAEWNSLDVSSWAQYNLLKEYLLLSDFIMSDWFSIFPSVSLMKGVEVWLEFHILFDFTESSLQSSYLI